MLLNQDDQRYVKIIKHLWKLWELDLATRKATGACVLIPWRTGQTLKGEIETFPGSLIFTDRHKSYHLGRRQKYLHRAVNHKAGEFSRMERMFG